jgi:uncharacterized membrane protein YkvA (DUF1232 family)
MLNKLKETVKLFKQEIKIYQLVLKDTRTPRISKVILGVAVGYAVCPFDLIPDFIPVIGHLDDAIIIPVLIYIAIKTIPKEIIEDCRNKAKDQLH